MGMNFILQMHSSTLFDLEFPLPFHLAALFPDIVGYSDRIRECHRQLPPPIVHSMAFANDADLPKSTDLSMDCIDCADALVKCNDKKKYISFLLCTIN